MIVFVLNSLGRGGAERSILLLAEELVRLGESVQIVCLFKVEDEYQIPEILNGKLFFLGSTSFMFALLRLSLHLLGLRPKIIFSLMPQANLASSFIGFFLGLSVLTSERTTPISFYRSRLKLSLSLIPHTISRRAVFISHYALEQGLPKNALGRAVFRNACVLHNPVHCSFPLAEACNSRLFRMSRLRRWVSGDMVNIDPLRLLIASRLVAGKGVMEFVETALDELATCSIQLIIAGVGPLLAPLQALVKRKGLSSMVHFLGYVDDIQTAYADADVVVLTSESEGFGRVGFEAYQAGCLVLGTQRNSFGHELQISTPAWKVLPHLAAIKPALLSLAGCTVPESGEDIDGMREALGIEAHARHFINIVSPVIHND
jgi:glycosyltransferase involved in cell wall biosynthesis